MFYLFHQNNSYGKFLKPAREVVVEADNEAEALDIVQTIEGVYFKGSSDRDCPCCGSRWSKFPLEYNNDEFEQYLADHREFMAWLTPSIPQILIRYKDGNTKTIQNVVEKANDIPALDAQMPIAIPEETHEPSESTELQT